jgi:hypothetical protein
MKIVKANSKKTTIKMSQKEWLQIGLAAKWIPKTAYKEKGKYRPVVPPISEEDAANEAYRRRDEIDKQIDKQQGGASYTPMTPEFKERVWGEMDRAQIYDPAYRNAVENVKAPDGVNKYQWQEMVIAVYPAFVTVYGTNQAYGGPEEGGWHYTVNEPVESVLVTNADHAANAYLHLKQKYDRIKEGRDGYGRYENLNRLPEDTEDDQIPRGMIMDSDYENYYVSFEQEKGQDATQERPHYE